MAVFIFLLIKTVPYLEFNNDHWLGEQNQYQQQLNYLEKVLLAISFNQDFLLIVLAINLYRLTKFKPSLSFPCSLITFTTLVDLSLV